jgi:hypothetical protein
VAAQDRGAEAGRVGAADLERLPQQRAAGVVDAQAGAGCAALLAVAAEDEFVAQQQAGAFG